MSNETQTDVGKKRSKPSPKVVEMPFAKVVPAVKALPPPAVEVLSPARTQVVAPAGISKSMAKAIGCGPYFAGQYLQPESIGYAPHYLAQVGVEFHEWRKNYVEHLVCIGASQDLAYKEFYLATEHLAEDTRKLIERDDFTVDPDTVLGCEVFLSIDRQFRPLEELHDQKPGALSSNPNFLCSGTLDLLLLINDGRKIVIRDPKSGWSTVGVTDEEPPIYAALVMAHFPKVDEVEFIWDFIRAEAIKRSSYTRDDLPWIHEMILALDEKKNEIVAAYNRGETLPPNPFSGLCPYCQVTCPMRPRWDAGELAIGPCQNDEDFRRLVMLKKVCDDVSSRIGQVALSYLDETAAVKDLGNGWEAAACSYSTYEYPLLDGLRTLGLKVVHAETGETPAYTPAYDVPLASLQLSGLSSYAKTKKSQKRAGGGGGISREGMKDELRAIARESAATRLRIRKTQQQDLTEQLEASIAQLQPSGT